MHLCFKGAVLPIFSITVKSQETHAYRWMSTNNGPVLLKWLFYRTETIVKCVWSRVVRMEMDSNLKTSILAVFFFFQGFARVSNKIGKN